MKSILVLMLVAMATATEKMDSETAIIPSTKFTMGNTTLYGGTLGETDWGSLGNMEACATGSYVRGFRLKVEPYQTAAGDDTALNAVQFLCNNGQLLSSKIGPFGDWKNWLYCPEGETVNGISMRSEKDQGIFVDDTAGNNVNLRCTDGTWLYGDGMDFGSWKTYYCPTGDKICGLQTRVEGSVTLSDDTALNQISVLCC